MKEQDFIHRIDEQTKNLPIPDSISPEAMKKMLDEHIHQNNDDRMSSEALKNTNDAQNKKRHIRQFTAVACVVLCLVGSISVSRLLSNQNTSENDSSVQSDETMQTDSVTEQNSDEAAVEQELAYQTNLHSPASYEEYYNTIKSAYDAYYDSISTVVTNDGEDEAVMENAEDFNAIAGAVKDKADTAKYSSTDTGTGRGELSKTADGDFSTTNTQEKTVDEGDIIKTDGTYIYKVITGYDRDSSHTTYRLTITKTDSGKVTFVTSFDLTEAIQKKNSDDYIDFKEFYLYQNQLVCMYTMQHYNTEVSGVTSYIVIYDLKDKKNPKKVKTLSQSGWYESSRISNGYLYTISNYTDTSLSDIKKYENYIPCVNDKTITCGNIYYPSDVLLESTHVITTLNLDKPADFTDTKAVPSTGTQAYVSDSAIYLYSTLYGETTKTEIMKISYSEGKLTVGNSAVIAGNLYGPFAINEHNGYLRIVATIPANNISLLRDFAAEKTNSSADSETFDIKEDVNALYILDENMELTGKIAGIAPGEIIHSARFMGDIGYFVTYRNTDPLFSVDLSDPANPVILGSLKVTGFSSYLHFYGENTLLGIGEETDPKTQEFLGIKLSMFDISNPSDVKEEDKYIIQNSGYSEALYDYKAIMIDPDKNIFGFVYAASTGKDYEYHYYYSTYAYEEKYGFIETARYAIDNPSALEDGTTRGLYIGDYFYLATNNTIAGYKIGSEEMISKAELK